MKHQATPQVFFSASVAAAAVLLLGIVAAIRRAKVPPHRAVG